MSEIKVNKISPKQTCTQLTLGDSGDTIIIPAGANLNTDAIKNLSTSSIITQTNATTITLGYSGSTIAIASGATQTGFGATGAVNWDTTAKTTTVTAASGVGYFINTTSAGVTVNLPAGTAGSIVSLSDYAGTWAIYNVTVAPNGSQKIGGIAAPATLNTKGQAVTFVYVDSTQGWINTGDATSITGTPPFVAATGGCITTCGDYKIHTFTGPGTFTVTNAGSPTGSTTVDYLIIAGGGSSSGDGAGGAGAGGYRINYPNPATGGTPVAVTGYPVVIGAGGSQGPTSAAGNPGSPSSALSITSTGGGGSGGGNNTPNKSGASGGSGGGGGARGGSGGAGNTPPVSPSQGNNGAPGASPAPGDNGGGGGGSGGAGSIPSGSGGPGTSSNITGSSINRAGGGGGGGGPGGPGGSADTPSGATPGTPPAGPNASAATANTGSGAGGGGMSDRQGASGGSGIVIIRYKFQ